MSSTPQPDPAPRKVDTFTPEFEAACNRYFWGEALPRVPFDPAINLQAKVDQLVAKESKSEPRARTDVLLGERTEILAVGAPLRVMRDKLPEIAVPLVAITGLPILETAPRGFSVVTPQLRLGIYYTGKLDGSDGERGKLSIFALVPEKALQAGHFVSQPNDIVGALQWLQLISKVGELDSSILTQSRQAVFRGPGQPGTYKNLQRQVGLEAIADARSQPLGNIDSLLARVLALKMPIDELPLVDAARRTLPIVEKSNLVQQQIYHYEDRHIPGRQLAPEHLAALVKLDAWNWRAVSYRWNFEKACKKHGDVRPAAYALLAQAERFRTRPEGRERAVSAQLLRDLKELSADFQDSQTYPPMVVVAEGISPMLERVARDLTLAVTHAGNLDRGYSRDLKATRSAFVAAATDFRGLHQRLYDIVHNLASLQDYSKSEMDESVRGGDRLESFRIRAGKLLSDLNRDLRLQCPGLFVL